MKPVSATLWGIASAVRSCPCASRAPFGEGDDVVVGEIGGLDAAGQAVFGPQPRHPAGFGCLAWVKN
jgi:hypothetical protein